MGLKKHRSGTTNRKRDRVVGRSVSIGVGQDRPSSGFGYIILPSDIDRLDYINYVYRTGLCIILTSFNDVYKNVRVPKHMMGEIVFPETNKDYGQLISWINTPVINQVTLYGFIQGPDEVYSDNEHTKSTTFSKFGKTFSRTSKIDDSSINHTVRLSNSNDEDGEIIFEGSSALGNAKIRIGLNGALRSYADFENVIESHENVQIITGTEEDENISKLNISTEGIFEFTDYNGNYIKVEKGITTVESKDGEILLGEGATEYAMLGNKTKTELEKLSARVDLLFAAIRGGAPATGAPDSGATLKSTMTAILAAEVGENFSSILSSKNKVE